MSAVIDWDDELFSKDSYELPDLSDLSLSSWSWETILFPLAATRMKGILWVLLVCGALAFGYFGTKDAGSYYSSYDGTSYEAGSILDPERYYFDSNDADATGTGLFGPTQSQGEAAEKEVNSGVERLRNENMPGFLCGACVFAATALFAFGGAWGMVRMQAAIKPLMNDRRYRRVFMDEYGHAHPLYVPTPLDGVMGAPLGLFSFAIERCLSRGGMRELHERGIPAELVERVRKQARCGTPPRIYLLLDQISDPQDFDDPSMFEDGAAAGGEAGAVSEPVSADSSDAEPGSAPGGVAAPVRAAAGSVAAVPVAESSGRLPVASDAVPQPQVPAAPQPPAQPDPPRAPRVMRFCPQCGARLVVGTAYCPLCGAHVSRDDG